MRIININGPINSGKSTISKLLTNALPKALFIEVDDLLSDEEEKKLGLYRETAWAERTRRLATMLKEEKEKQNYQNIIFAYPIAENLYNEWKSFADEATTFINITLAPKLEVCLQNRGSRELKEWEVARIKQMYQEGYNKREFADLIIDNSTQPSKETLDEVLSFLSKEK